MATFQTTVAAAQDNYSKLRNGRASLRALQADMKVAYFEYTATGDEVTTDSIDLGSLDLEGAVIVPAACTVRVDSGVTMTNTLKIGATAATATAVTTAVAATTTGAAFAGVAAPVAASRSDKLFLTTSSTLTLAATKKVYATIAYYCPRI